MDGIMRCSRYSFGPNRLHYCGPDANAELKAHIDAGAADPGLATLLKQFKTLFPYLRYIAESNGIKDPFDPRVVEAYWLGNELLERAEKRKLYQFLLDGFNVKKKMSGKEFAWLEEKIGQGAVPHHSFHVLNIWHQMGSENVPHTVESMRDCCINAGTITAVNGPEIAVTAESLVYTGGKFALGSPAPRTLVRKLEAEYDIEQLKPGQIISFHWGVPCEVISKEQAAALRKYTLKNIAFANQTI